jgi:hypothetical protein
MNRLFIRIDPRLSLIIGLLFLVLALLWQSFDAALAPPADRRLPPHPLFFWKADGGRGTILLLGSVHIGNAELYPAARRNRTGF